MDNLNRLFFQRKYTWKDVQQNLPIRDPTSYPLWCHNKKHITTSVESVEKMEPSYVASGNVK